MNQVITKNGSGGTVQKRNHSESVQDSPWAPGRDGYVYSRSSPRARDEARDGIECAEFHVCVVVAHQIHDASFCA